MSICALTSAINASARELGRQLDGKPFLEMHHAGAERQVFMARCAAGAQEFLFVGVFDRESSFGVVEIYFEEFQKALEKLRPEQTGQRVSGLRVISKASSIAVSTLSSDR